MKLVDYEKYYHSESEFIIPRDEFEKIIEENQRLKKDYATIISNNCDYLLLQEENQRLKDRIDFYEDIESDRLAYIDELEKENQRLNIVLNEIKKIVDDYYTYDYENENLERLNVIDKINSIVFKELKESDK